MKIDDIIQKYSLQKHPEGGFFAENYRSSSIVNNVNGSERPAVTDIYYLLQQGQISRFHKVVSDELWHFYEGASLRLFKYDGNNVSETVIGPNCADGYKVVVEGGVYQAAISAGEYSLVGCTVAPGFEFEDFSFFSDCPEIADGFKLQFPYLAYLL